MRLKPRFPDAVPDAAEAASTVPGNPDHGLNRRTSRDSRCEGHAAPEAGCLPWAGSFKAAAAAICVSRRAFRYHLAFTLLDAVFAGITGNAPLMAVKAMGATDVQLQVPLAMASIGLFAGVFAGAAMATRRKKPFVVAPGIAEAVSALLMAWMRRSSAAWFLALSGAISIFDFAMRPAVPSILRSVYPDRTRSHVAGTMRQYASVVFLASTLASAWFLSIASSHVMAMIRIQLVVAGLFGLASYACFKPASRCGRWQRRGNPASHRARKIRTLGESQPAEKQSLSALSGCVLSVRLCESVPLEELFRRSSPAIWGSATSKPPCCFTSSPTSRHFWLEGGFLPGSTATPCGVLIRGSP